MGSRGWWIGGVVALGLGAAVLFEGGALHGMFADGHDYSAAPECRIPVTYHLDAVDPRFELARDEVQRALDEAVAMWESETEAELFRERAGEGMPVSLVFDERQALAQAREQSRGELARAQASLEADQERLDHRRSALAADVERYERRVREFESRRREHEQAVAAWNAGRTEQTAASRQRLERAGRDLEEEHRRLEDSRRELDRRRDELQARAREVEQAVESFNARVQAHNEEGAGFTGFNIAVYEQEGAQRWITVYKASDREALRLALAHELGHALGIGHVHDPAAVMHAELSGANAGREELTAADRAALAESCELDLRQ